MPYLGRSQVVCLLRGWFTSVSAALTAAVLGVVVSNWMYVSAMDSDLFDHIGLWRTCHQPNLTSNLSISHLPSPHLDCASLNRTVISGWYQTVRALCTISTGMSVMAAAGLCVLLVYRDSWSGYRRQYGLAIYITVALWTAALTEFSGVAVHALASNKTLLPVCVSWCPDDIQPMSSCRNSTSSTAMKSLSCETHLGPGYYFTLMAGILDLLAAVLGVIVILVVSGGGRNCQHKGVDGDDLLGEPDSTLNATGSDVAYHQQRPRLESSDVSN